MKYDVIGEIELLKKQVNELEKRLSNPNHIVKPRVEPVRDWQTYMTNVWLPSNKGKTISIKEFQTELSNAGLTVPGRPKLERFSKAWGGFRVGRLGNTSTPTNVVWYLKING